MNQGDSTTEEDVPSFFGRLMSVLRRRRSGGPDIGVLTAVLMVVLFLAFEIDVYQHQGHLSPQEELVELDKVLTLGGVLALGLLAFSIRRHRAQKRELARRTAAEQQIRILAFQDALTGLANRRRFDESLRQALGSPPAANAAHAVFLLDLNGFKTINDLYGHGTGDEVLVVVAQRLLEGVRPGDFVARFGGDEFAVLARDLDGPEAASAIARRLVAVLDSPIAIGTSSHRVSAGIGIALLPTDATTLQEALRKADVALYRAKAERRGAFRYFEASMDQQIQERDALEQALRAALAIHAVQPHFLSAVDLRSQVVVGFKVIPHWIDATLGPVPPERLLPLAEDAGLLHELNDALLRQACREAAAWPSGVLLSMDVAPGVLRDRSFHERVRNILLETGLPPDRLELEIAESALVRDLEGVREALGGLREGGVRIALGRFGTGYSSLYHLRNFTFDRIKIDRSFIDSWRAQPESASIVSALVGLGQGLGLSVSADGTCDAALQASLMGMGCQQGQSVSGDEALPAAAAARLVATTP